MKRAHESDHETDAPQFITVTDAARLLAVHRQTVYAMIRAGKLPAVACASVWRVPLSAVQGMVERSVEVADALAHARLTRRPRRRRSGEVE